MKKIIIIHPILFAIFPILFLYDYNKDLMKFSYIIFSLIFSIILTVLLFFIIKRITKNINKTAIITSLFLLLFFSFGHFLDLTTLYAQINYNISYALNYFILLIIWVILFTFLSALIIDSKNFFYGLNKYLNAVTIILVILPLLNISIYNYQENSTSVLKKNITALAREAEERPDIYYIILDGYGRADILKELYNYNNSEFINYLTNKGFYVARQSRANYPQTYLSVSSALNMNYIDKLIDIDEESDNRGPLKKLLKDNKVYYFLKEYNYKFVAMPFTWTGTYKNIHANITIGQNSFNFNEFENILINTTPLKIIFDKSAHLHSLRKKILFALEHIPDIAEINNPTFSYVHIIAPHPPFIFDADGNAIVPDGSGIGSDGNHYFRKSPDKEQYKIKYINQLKFINKQTIKMIDEIIGKSKQPPIIILQSDHGPGLNLEWENPEKTNMKERMSNLNAYYVPEKTKKLLYNSITPVNSFRIIFNSVFNADFELLEDKSYFATWLHPYKFIDVE